MRDHWHSACSALGPFRPRQLITCYSIYERKPRHVKAPAAALCCFMEAAPTASLSAAQTCRRRISQPMFSEDTRLAQLRALDRPRATTPPAPYMSSGLARATGPELAVRRVSPPGASRARRSSVASCEASIPVLGPDHVLNSEWIIGRAGYNSDPLSGDNR